MHKRDDEMKNVYFTVANEGIVEYGYDFIKCKIKHDRNST